MHHVSCAEHMESCPSDEVVKCGRDDVMDLEDVSGVTHPSQVLTCKSFSIIVILLSFIPLLSS